MNEFMHHICQSLQIPLDHPSYAGHFPSQAILPGVMLIDMIVQLIKKQHSDQNELRLWHNLELRNAKFLQPIFPGDDVHVCYTIIGLDRINFDVKKADVLTASGQFRLN